VKINRKFSIAPMMDYTDRHCRYFLRLITRHTLLYTEMITSDAILKGDRDHLLAYSESEHPLVLQLGGSDAGKLARCAIIAEDYGYDEINFNVGCPSNRVQAGRFGACLMAEPELVGECITAMQQSTKIPVTVKTRIGIDDRDSYDELAAFIMEVNKSGCNTFIMHARKALLKGLSPKENREVPPLHYSTVYQLKKDFPDLEIIINGGFTSMEQILEQYHFVDGVMIGRAAYHDPYLLAEADGLIFGDKRAPKDRQQILNDYTHYIIQQLDQGIAFKQMTRHILGLYQGMPGARAYRRKLSQHDRRSDADIDILKQAVEQIT
jgi:tRNA-dihydrouridine synthase A